MQHRTIRGRISYISRKPESRDQVRGGERFTYTVHGDGTRILRTHCAIQEPAPTILRDTVTNLDANWMPTGGFVQITVDDKLEGWTWYSFSEREAVCEGQTRAQGRISKRLQLESPPAFLVSHPLQSDGMLTHAFDLSKGPGVQKTSGFLSCSLHHRGADGPSLFAKSEMTLRFLGSEEVTVEAGTFDALHFQIGATVEDTVEETSHHPTYHMWVTADGNYVMLKAEVGGYIRSYYELAEYDVGDGYL